jgi:hypothetical protein
MYWCNISGGIPVRFTVKDYVFQTINIITSMYCNLWILVFDCIHLFEKKKLILFISLKAQELVIYCGNIYPLMRKFHSKNQI